MKRVILSYQKQGVQIFLIIDFTIPLILFFKHLMTVGVFSISKENRSGKIYFSNKTGILLKTDHL